MHLTFHVSYPTHLTLYVSHLMLHPDTLYSSVDELAMLLLVKYIRWQNFHLTSESNEVEYVHTLLSG